MTTSIPGALKATGRTLVFLVLATGALSAASRDAGADGVDHVITFVNQCKQQVWLAEFGSTSIPPADWALAPTCTEATKDICPTGTCQEGSCTCASDADCTFGSAADTTASCDTTSGKCVKTTTVDAPPGWSGRFWARTGCSGTDASFVCETGQCGPDSGGNIDCTVQNASANLATLFEIAAAGNDGADNFDVSLVSGYNLPVVVKVQLPPDAPHWQASTSFAAGAQIIERVGRDTFGFTNGGSTGTSGAVKPQFPGVWTGTVTDANGIVWVNTGPVCETSGCTRGGIAQSECPSALRITAQGSGKYIGCDAPANVCSQPGAGCAPQLDYYQCQNNDGATDLFGKILTLQSPNAATFVCFSAADCPHGTTCELNPAFASGFSLATGAGVCTPVAQNGGCVPGGDGQPCPAINYPFVDYVCQTLSDQQSNAQVCVPPKTRGLGDLWWNAANWTEAAGPVSCTDDSGCSGNQKCLTGPTHEGLEQCPPASGSCTCWNPKTCTAATCPGANQCLNTDGVPDGKMDGGSVVDCTTATCYCGPQGVYSGTCGPTNAKWLQASRKISEPGSRWPQTIKRECPVAYSYQFDDPSSNWSCTNPSGGLNDYRVVFCGKGVK